MARRRPTWKKVPGSERGAPLSVRERDVIAAIRAGHVTNVAIARYLTISPGTARGHISNVYLKTGAVNMADLVLMAFGHKPSAVQLDDGGPLPADNAVIE